MSMEAETGRIHQYKTKIMRVSIFEHFQRFCLLLFKKRYTKKLVLRFILGGISWQNLFRYIRRN